MDNIITNIAQLRQQVLDGLRDILLYVDSPSNTLKMAARVKLTDLRERVPSALNHIENWKCITFALDFYLSVFSFVFFFRQ